LLPAEPNPVDYASFAAYATAMRNWSSLVASTPLLLSPSAAQLADTLLPAGEDTRLRLRMKSSILMQQQPATSASPQPAAAAAAAATTSATTSSSISSIPGTTADRFGKDETTALVLLQRLLVSSSRLLPLWCLRRNSQWSFGYEYNAAVHRPTLLRSAPMWSPILRLAQADVHDSSCGMRALLLDNAFATTPTGALLGVRVLPDSEDYVALLAQRRQPDEEEEEAAHATTTMTSSSSSSSSRRTTAAVGPRRADRGDRVERSKSSSSLPRFTLAASPATRGGGGGAHLLPAHPPQSQLPSRPTSNAAAAAATAPQPPPQPREGAATLRRVASPASTTSASNKTTVLVLEHLERLCTRQSQLLQLHKRCGSPPVVSVPSVMSMSMIRFSIPSLFEFQFILVIIVFQGEGGTDLLSWLFIYLMAAEVHQRTRYYYNCNAHRISQSETRNRRKYRTLHHRLHRIAIGIAVS
jgi:hypothetical protein